MLYFIIVVYYRIALSVVITLVIVSTLLVAIASGGAMAPQSRNKNYNGEEPKGPINLCLIYSHKVQWVSGCLCKSFLSSPTLSQIHCYRSNRIKLGILSLAAA